MENVANKFEQLVKQLESDKANYDQLSRFDETIKNLQKIIPIDKPSYVFPQVDTIGKHTFSSLNKK